MYLLGNAYHLTTGWKTV